MSQATAPATPSNRNTHATLAPAMLTVTQVAQRLAVSVRSVERLAEAGAIPRPMILGRSVRWTIASIDAFLAGTWAPAPAPQGVASSPAADKPVHRERDQ